MIYLSTCSCLLQVLQQQTPARLKHLIQSYLKYLSHMHWVKHGLSAHTHTHMQKHTYTHTHTSFKHRREVKSK